MVENNQEEWHPDVPNCISCRENGFRGRYDENDKSATIYVLELGFEGPTNNYDVDRNKLLQYLLSVINFVSIEILELENQHAPFRFQIIFGGISMNLQKVSVLDPIKNHMRRFRFFPNVLSLNFAHTIDEVLSKFELIYQWDDNEMRNILHNILITSFSPNEDDPRLNDQLRNILVDYIVDLAISCREGNYNLPPIPAQLLPLRDVVE